MRLLVPLHSCIRESSGVCLVDTVCVCACNQNVGQPPLIHAAFEPKILCLLALAVGLPLGEARQPSPHHPPIQIRSPLGHNHVHPGVKHMCGHLV
jgi:hypothetical protein